MSDELRAGQVRKWAPGLRMDPDTGERVVLVRPMDTAFGGKWWVRVIRSGREGSAYWDELGEVIGEEEVR